MEVLSDFSFKPACAQNTCDREDDWSRCARRSRHLTPGRAWGRKNNTRKRHSPGAGHCRARHFAHVYHYLRIRRQTSPRSYRRLSPFRRRRVLQHRRRRASRCTRHTLSHRMERKNRRQSAAGKPADHDHRRRKWEQKYFDQGKLDRTP